MRLLTRLAPSGARWIGLGLGVLLGPLGVGYHASAAVQKTCGVSCPCEDEPHAESPCTDDCADHEAGHDEAPCGHECPDNCSECSCCVGVSSGVLAAAVAATPQPTSSSRMFPPADDLPLGVLSGVFRPPRTLIRA